jgi:DNA-binding NarL/FixJ family response regulator
MEQIIASNGKHISSGASPALLAKGGMDDATENEGKEGRNCSLVLLDNRALDRECLAQGIKAYKPNMEVLAFGSIEEWKHIRDEFPPLAAILLHVGGKDIADPQVGDEIRRLVAEFKAAPLIVLADSDQLGQILKALEYGARGYIPSNVGIRVCAEVIELALAGGIFVPASSVLAVREVLAANSEIAQPLAGLFTLRQAEVVEALRRGKANKIIAYELNLRESTVKVHIRNIMKKLNATNRTEVAFKLRDLFPAGHG